MLADEEDEDYSLASSFDEEVANQHEFENRIEEEKKAFEEQFTVKHSMVKHSSGNVVANSKKTPSRSVSAKFDLSGNHFIESEEDSEPQVETNLNDVAGKEELSSQKVSQQKSVDNK